MSQTVHEFINCYEGFDYENGEIVIFNQRTGQHSIVKATKKHELAPRVLTGSLLLEDMYNDRFRNRGVWNWTHTGKTMLIIL